MLPSVAEARFRELLDIFQLGDTDSLREGMDQANCIISGSAALYIFHPTAFLPNDIDFYVPLSAALDFEYILHQRGYSDTAGNGMYTFYPAETIVTVARLLKPGLSRTINLITTRSENPLTAVVQFHSTLVMNAITSHGVICLYPLLTLAGRGIISVDTPASRAPGYVAPTAIDDPRKLIAQFKQAAINAKKAGFDGVELHGANGYLVHQFLDTSSNKRSDEWGGSKENRARFALETLKALKEVFGRNVAVKASPAGGYNDMGMPLDETLDTYRYYFSELDKLGLAYINLSRYAPVLDAEYDGVSRATKHDVLGSYLPVIKSTPIFLNGSVLPEEGAQLVALGQIDGISIGVNWITHPDLVKRVEHGKPLDNVPDYQHFQTDDYEGPEDWSKGYTDYPVAVY